MAYDVPLCTQGRRAIVRVGRQRRGPEIVVILAQETRRDETRGEREHGDHEIQSISVTIDKCIKTTALSESIGITFRAVYLYLNESKEWELLLSHAQST